MVRKKIDVSEELVRRASAALPSFTDVFDEESFYLFFFGLTIFAIFGAFLASRFFKIDIHDADSQLTDKRR